MKTIRMAAVGLDHRHIYGMSQGMIDAGAELVAYWTEGHPEPLTGFSKRFPDVPRQSDLQVLLDDESIQLFLIASAPEHRAELSLKAMQHGKDVMLDKPGCLTLDELNRLRATIDETGKIWSVNFSERFEVPAVTRADELLQQGRIGKVIQTISMGPHRLNAPTRPEWFWEASRYGGILGDIGTHQIDQFLHFAKAPDARIVSSAVGNFAHTDKPQFQDFGEINLATEHCQGYARLDWFTPDALPTWGDGRLTILGSEGYIELRKYTDITRSASTDHVFLVNQDEHIYIDASDAGTPYFDRFAGDLLNRTQNACSQAHTLKVMELAITAQSNAERRGSLAP